MEVRTYRMYALWRFQILAMFAIFAVAAVALLVAALGGGHDAPPLAFSLLWIAIAVWNAYWFLWRVAYQLELDDEQLRWHAPLRQGVIPLAELQELKPFLLGSSVEVFRSFGRPDVLVFVRRGLKDFAEVIKERAPHVAIRFGTYARIAERLPGPRGFRR